MSSTLVKGPRSDGGNRGGKLSANDVHNVLRNERRAEALEVLRDGSGETTLRDLSESIAVSETGESPPPRGVRDSVYASLHQTHLPMLESHGIVEYEQRGKRITMGPRARDLDPYLNVTTATGQSWQLRYIFLGVTGIVVVALAGSNVPLLSLLPPSAWAIGFLLAFLVAVLYQYGRRDLWRRALARIPWTRLTPRTRPSSRRRGTEEDDTSPTKD